jgi:hypothetical protein
MRSGDCCVGLLGNGSGGGGSRATDTFDHLDTNRMLIGVNHVAIVVVEEIMPIPA